MTAKKCLVQMVAYPASIVRAAFFKRWWKTLGVFPALLDMDYRIMQAGKSDDQGRTFKTSFGKRHLARPLPVNMICLQQRWMICRCRCASA